MLLQPHEQKLDGARPAADEAVDLGLVHAEAQPPEHLQVQRAPAAQAWAQVRARAGGSWKDGEPGAIKFSSKIGAARARARARARGACAVRLDTHLYIFCRTEFAPE